MKSLPVLKEPITIRYLNSTDNFVYYFQQMILSGQLKQGEPLPTQESMARNLGVPVSDISRALFKLHLCGVVTTSKREIYVSTLSIKLKEHIFLFLLRGRPSVLRVNNRLPINDAAASSTAHGGVSRGIRSVKSLLAEPSLVLKTACTNEYK